MPSRLIGAYTELVVWILLALLIMAGISALMIREEARLEEVKAKAIYFQFVKIEEILIDESCKVVITPLIIDAFNIILRGKCLVVKGHHNTYSFNLSLSYKPTILKESGTYQFEKAGQVEVVKL